MKGLMELLNMVKNMETIQKGKTKTIKYVPFKGNNKKFADLLKSVKRELSVRKKSNILRDSKLQKVEIPKEMIVELFDRVTSEEGKAEGIDVLKKDVNHQPEEKKTDEKSQRTVDERSESVSKKPSVGKARKGKNISSRRTGFVKKGFYTTLYENAKQNNAEKSTLNLTEIEKGRDNELLIALRDSKLQKVEIPKEMIVELFDRVTSEEGKAEGIDVLKKDVNHQPEEKKTDEKSQRTVDERSESVSKKPSVGKARKGKNISSRRTGFVKKGFYTTLYENAKQNNAEKSTLNLTEIEKGRDNEHSVETRKREKVRPNEFQKSPRILKTNQGKNEVKEKETMPKKVVDASSGRKHEIEMNPEIEEKATHDVFRINQNKGVKDREKENQDSRNRKITIVESKNEGEIGETQKLGINEHGKVPLKDPVEIKEFKSALHLVSKEKNVNERKDNAHVKKIKNDAGKMSIIEGEERSVNKLKDAETRNHESLNAGANSKPVESVPVSEKLVKRSRKIVSHNEEVVEKVIEVVKEDGAEYIKEVVTERIVMNKEPHYKIEETIQNQRNQTHHEEQPYPIKETTMKASLKDESFFKRLNVETIKMETSSSKGHHVEIERNISLKQSSERIERDKGIERAKDIIIKRTAQKKYTAEKEISIVDLKAQNFSKTKDTSEIKMDVGEDRKITLESVIEKVKEMAQKRIEKAFVQLEPPKLGKMEIEILKDGDGLRITLKVSTNEAKEILEKGSKYLVARLENLGFRIEDIQIKENSEESYDEEGERQNEENDFRENREGEDRRRKFREIFKRKVNEE